MTETYVSTRLAKAVANGEYWYRETCRLREEVERIREERDEARHSVAQANGHNLLLQDTVDQQRERLAAQGAALTRKNSIESVNYRDPYEGRGDMPLTGNRHDLAAALAAIDTDSG